MKKKNFALLTLSLILFNFFFIAIFTINASGVEYSIDVNENEIFIWKIEKFDQDTYEAIFVGEKIAFEEDDLRKYQIMDIDKSTEYWKISYYIWDYTDDSSDFEHDADEEEKYKIYRDPEDQADDILLIEEIIEMWLIPIPYTNYLEDFKDEFDHQIIRVYLEDESLIAKISATEEIPATYEVELTYDINGVMEKLEYYDQNGDEFLEIVLQKEAIPGYDVILIFGIIIICGTISVIIWWKKLHINND
ncbi:MAG: hypothetical protein ACFE8A_08970 [Candidatus Hodarchaeota archaeon]